MGPLAQRRRYQLHQAARRRGRHRRHQRQRPPSSRPPAPRPAPTAARPVAGGPSSGSLFAAPQHSLLRQGSWWKLATPGAGRRGPGRERGRRPDESRGRDADGDGERAEPRSGRRASASERAPTVARPSTPVGITARSRGITLTALCPAAEIAKTACQSGILCRGGHPPGSVIPAAAGDFWYPARHFWPRQSDFWPRQTNKRRPDLEGLARLGPAENGGGSPAAEKSGVLSAAHRRLRQPETALYGSRGRIAAPCARVSGRAAGRTAFSDRRGLFLRSPGMFNTRARARIPHEPR
jgi:hypothetical protein